MKSETLIPPTLDQVRIEGAHCLYVKLNCYGTELAQLVPEFNGMIYGSGRLGTMILSRLIARVIEAGGCCVRTIGSRGEFCRALIRIGLLTNKFPLREILAELEQLNLLDCATVASFDSCENIFRVHHPIGGKFSLDATEFAADDAALCADFLNLSESLRARAAQLGIDLGEPPTEFRT